MSLYLYSIFYLDFISYFAPVRYGDQVIGTKICPGCKLIQFCKKPTLKNQTRALNLTFGSLSALIKMSSFQSEVIFKEEILYQCQNLIMLKGLTGISKGKNGLIPALIVVDAVTWCTSQVFFTMSKSSPVVGY